MLVEALLVVDEGPAVGDGLVKRVVAKLDLEEGAGVELPTEEEEEDEEGEENRVPDRAHQDAAGTEETKVES